MAPAQRNGRFWAGEPSPGDPHADDPRPILAWAAFGKLNPLDRVDLATLPKT